MFDAIRKLRELPSSERRLLAGLGVMQPLLSLSLRWLGLNATRDWLARRSARGAARQASLPDLLEAQRTAHLSAVAGRHGAWQTTCLPQALAIYWLLRRRHLDPVLKLGVDRIGAIPDMHAWVELEGVPLGQPSLRHQPFLPVTSANMASTTVSKAS